MTFYTGSSEDGRDIRPIEGAYINPDNPDEWSSEPYSKDRKGYSKRFRKLSNHIDGKRTIMDEYKLIKSKKSDLSKDMRDFVIGMIEEEQ